ncbi:MAG: lipoyltransferase and lipoate-protein ligase [Solidesulfovibrio magneticus str. Maddingley MBC34]|uniref:lipoate--protein ligase n=1 Tax=Solidesulfovibrio magneticus str. Maddingley MBC34 TaxID=1206767 RepID=K6G8H8_9BACT|nr:MAG: lipoyltransferase and lipoate-protein ligase [Solidesulfovibrio magneticus str. Maddingley MBC34]
MRAILLETTDPALNLAAEEWLLKNAAADVFMLWRNAPAVIVGRNQNTRAQIDEAFTRERGIPVVRRLSGGGAVFHDLGNVNFTFISLGGGAMDFRGFTAPILAAVADLGVACAFEGRNDLTIEGKKFSGNAQHVWRDRVLHHGTLLFDADVSHLAGALRVDPEKYRDKAVKSVAKRVTNIAAHLPAPMAVTDFMAHVMGHVCPGATPDDLALAPDEAAGAAALAERRYRTYQWNFGASPAYGFSRTRRTPGGLIEAHLDVKGGVILAARLLGDYFGRRDVAELEAALTGCRHDRDALAERLGGMELEEYLLSVGVEELVECLF